MPEEIFVGRKSYSDTFINMLEAPEGSSYILNVYGPGGIGKTKILQKFIQICDKNDVPHAGIIDLYGFEMSSRISAVEMKIADALKTTTGRDSFETYWKVRNKYKNKHPHQRGVEYKQQFMEDLASWVMRNFSRGKRGVFIFDTFEEVRHTLVGIRILNDWLPKLKSALVVISGRQKTDEIDFPETIVDLVTPLPVKEFSEEEAIEYLQERGVWEAVRDEQIGSQLFKLSGRKPLLLALSADWMIDHDFFPTLEVSQLVEESDQESFERKLVERLPKVAGERPGADIPPPERTILPIMAHIIEPLNEGMLKFLLPGFPETQTVLQNLAETSFVKGVPLDNPIAYWFQDELRNLFHKHVFKDKRIEKEKWKRFRRDISKKMLSYYDEQISRKEDGLEKERAEASKLFHELFLNPDYAMKELFQNKFQTARDNHQYGFSSLLLSAVRFNQLDLPEQHIYHFRLQEGRWLRDMGAAKRAKKRFESLLAENPDNPDRTPFIYNALGATATKLGQYKEALEYHKKSLLLSNEHCINDRLAIEQEALGEVYLLQGDWEKSVQFFKKAYQSALLNLNKAKQNEEEKRNAWGGIAGILSNIGYAYGISGNSDIALNYIDQAIDIFGKLNAGKRAAKARIIKWDILRRKGDYKGTVEGIHKAIGEFEEIDHENRAEAFFYLGYAQWYRARTVNDPELLAESARSFEQCINLSRQFDITKELPRALHEISHVYWELGRKKEARKANDEAYDRALSSYDIYYAINALVKKAEFDFEDGDFEAVSSHAKEMSDRFEQNYKFPLFFGRMYRILGDVAYVERKIGKAFQEYGKGIFLIAQHGGYGKYTIEDELDRLSEKIEGLPLDEQFTQCLELKQYWDKQGADKKFPNLMAFADRHITRLAFEGKLSIDMGTHPTEEPKGC